VGTSLLVVWVCPVGIGGLVVNKSTSVKTAQPAWPAGRSRATVTFCRQSWPFLVFCITYVFNYRKLLARREKPIEFGALFNLKFTEQ
jgi:hypothetical protein